MAKAKAKATAKAKAARKRRPATKAPAPRLTPAQRKRATEAHRRQLAAEMALLEQERKAEAKARRAAAATLEEKFFRGLERIRKHMSLTGEARLRVVDVLAELARRGRPVARRGSTPWTLAAEITTPRPERMAYSDLYWALLATRDDQAIDRAFHPQRASRIQVVYQDPNLGEPRTWTLAEIGPWETVISRAVNRLDPNGARADSITVRYDDEADVPSQVLGIRVWLGLNKFSGVTFA